VFLWHAARTAVVVPPVVEEHPGQLIVIGETSKGTNEFSAVEEASVGGLTGASKVVFSLSLEDPITWANSTLVRDDAVDAVRAMKEEGRVC
jgi:hypothetical protein